MSMEAMGKLREMLCREMDDIAKKSSLSSGDLEALQKLTDTIKNIDKIEYLEDEGGYSEHGGSYDAGYYPMSHARSGQHYVRGHYSYDRGAYRGDRRGNGYSRSDDKEAILYQLGEMMDKATGEQKDIIRRALEELRTA